MDTAFFEASISPNLPDLWTPLSVEYYVNFTASTNTVGRWIEIDMNRIPGTFLACRYTDGILADYNVTSSNILVIPIPVHGSGDIDVEERDAAENDDMILDEENASVAGAIDPVSNASAVISFLCHFKSAGYREAMKYPFLTSVPAKLVSVRKVLASSRLRFPRPTPRFVPTTENELRFPAARTLASQDVHAIAEAVVARLRTVDPAFTTDRLVVAGVSSHTNGARMRIHATGVEIRRYNAIFSLMADDLAAAGFPLDRWYSPRFSSFVSEACAYDCAAATACQMCLDGQKQRCASEEECFSGVCVNGRCGMKNSAATTSIVAILIAIAFISAL
jgi:hypothetical protein